ncbi:MAG TPA: hypothetical protein VJT16_23520 [Streptosporangiaceae bacterium]|nr:hypothetical protein [Streptosporangiaceae bacterium]
MNALARSGGAVVGAHAAPGHHGVPMLASPASPAVARLGDRFVA